MLYGWLAIYDGILLLGTICSRENCPLGISKPDKKHISAISASVKKARLWGKPLAARNGVDKEQWKKEPRPPNLFIFC